MLALSCAPSKSLQFTDHLRSLPQDEHRIFVESEDEPNRVLLETKITKDDGYQKQQGSVFLSFAYLPSIC